MTALPGTIMPDGPLRHQAQIPSIYADAPESSAALPTIYRCIGAATVVAALGIWLVPGDSQDALMQLFKLTVSAALALVGSAFFAALRRHEGPIVRIDPKRRMIIITEFDTRGQVRMESQHDIDDLSEIELRDGLLTARDAQGRSLLALPVADAATRSALMKLLGMRGNQA